MSDPQNPLAGVVHPGVYVEETSYRARSISGVGTSATAFAGVAGKGPVNKVSGPLYSYAQFAEAYGEASEITFSSGEVQKCYLAQAAAAFFENGGTRLYVSRVTAEDGINSAPPTAADYARALGTLTAIGEIAIVAAPGGAIAGEVGSLHDALITHVNQARAYRFAVLDPPAEATIADMKALRARLDCRNAALYYPWIKVSAPVIKLAKLSETVLRPGPVIKPAPLLQRTVTVPPSGAMCGIFCRVDAARGAFKAPANEVITGAVSFEVALTDNDSDDLNPLGINCLRSFTGRGNRVWGARTVSSDPEWKYINVRRYLLYLEHSIDAGTQWVVFEPNGETLWNAVRQTITDFLYNEWRSGALLGAKPEEAYFVRCDRTTMTQDDIDSGRLVCLVGVAQIKPAEFVIFRIGQKTKDSQ
ncbi:MAG TPA: phage tail sheath subtilisin-like domain-containing protein [Edaphobacter sp.]